MFDANSERPKRPLLMSSPGEPSHAATVGNNAAQSHKQARSQRLNAGKRGALTGLLSRQSEAEHGIDNDIQTMFDRSSEQRAAAPYPYANDAHQIQAPLVDAATVLSTVWNWRYFIAGSTILGGVLGVFLALSIPQHYTAFTSVLVDPREIKLIDRDLTPEFLANEAALSIIDSRLQLAKSNRVLERVIERTNLSQDNEFNGEGTGASLGLSVITGLLSGNDKASSSKTRVTQENLRKAVQTSRENRTFVVNIGATSKNPEKAAILANEVANAFIEEQSGLTSETAADANQKLAGRLGSLRQTVEDAERAVEDFRVENNLVNAQGRLIRDDEIVAVNAALVKARGVVSEIRARADALRTADLNSVVSGILPTELVTPALTTFRAQFASLKQQVAAMEAQLGPRHPRLENMRAAAQAAANDIQSELNRIVAGAQADLRAAIQNEQQTAQKLAQLKAGTGDNAEAIVELRELERKATAARTIYESALVRSRETGELEAVNQGNSSIINLAEAPLTPSSTSRKLIVAGTSIAGFILSTAAAVMLGVGKSLSASIASSYSASQPTNNPTSPSPDQRTPNTPQPRGRRLEQDNDDFDQSSSSSEKKDMYPPYSPYGYPAHASAPQQHMSPQQQPFYSGYAQPAPMMQPTPYAGQPYGAPFMGYPMPPMAPQMQQPMMPVMQQPMPSYQPHPGYAPAPAPAPAPQNQHDAREMESLRESVRDIRDVLDHLTQRRYG